MSLRSDVQQRAADRCEYCRTPSFAGTVDFHLDHIIARYHGGETTFENLAWACAQCNRYKGTNLAGIDPETRHPALLFNPRIDIWDEHFEVQDSHISGQTPEGRATVSVLRFNDDERVEFRRVLIEKGKW
jgi:hypothetical protein